MEQIYALLSTYTKENSKEDAIGIPSDAARAIELGTDAVLVKMAVPRVENPSLMTKAIKLGVETGRLDYLAGRMPVDPIAQPSSPTRDVPVQTVS